MIIKDAEPLMRNIINGMHDPVFAVDREGTVIVWNRAMESLVDVSAEDMLGKGDYEYAIPFYEKKRPMLIDYVLSRNLPTTENCHYRFIEKSRDVLVAEIDRFFTKKKLYLWAKANVFYDTRGNVVGAVESIRDITQQKLVEQELQKRTETLEDTNTALKAFLQQIEADKNEAEEQFISNIWELIVPSIEFLKANLRDEHILLQLDVIEQNLKNIALPLVRRMKNLNAALTPKQLLIAGLVREGKPTEEISSILGVSPHAVAFHRKHIRRKLGLQNRGVNLRSYLLSLA